VPQKICARDKKGDLKMPTEQIEEVVTPVLVDTRCQFMTSSGRRCRNFAARDTSRASGLSTFCIPHSQLDQQFVNTKSVAEELLGNTQDFRTAVSVNDVLGRLFVLQAQNRIPIRNAMALAYTAQVILSSIETVRDEVISAEGRDSHEELILTAISKAYGNQDEDEEEEDEEESGEKIAEQEEQEEPHQVPATREEFDAQVAATVKIRNGG
jgi:hypothetical protein